MRFKDTCIDTPQETLERLFALFFITKAQGMGMGLPISKIFVESNGGFIEVKSEKCKGLSFTKVPICPLKNFIVKNKKTTDGSIDQILEAV